MTEQEILEIKEFYKGIEIHQNSTKFEQDLGAYEFTVIYRNVKSEIIKLKKHFIQSDEGALFQTYKNERIATNPYDWRDKFYAESEYPQAQNIISQGGFSKNQYNCISQLKNCTDGALSTLINLDDKDFLSPCFLRNTMNYGSFLIKEKHGYCYADKAICDEMSIRFCKLYKNSDEKTRLEITPLLSALKDWVESADWLPSEAVINRHPTVAQR